jgi:hypothetical protein
MVSPSIIIILSLYSAITFPQTYWSLLLTSFLDHISSFQSLVHIRNFVVDMHIRLYNNYRHNSRDWWRVRSTSHCVLYSEPYYITTIMWFLTHTLIRCSKIDYQNSLAFYVYCKNDNKLHVASFFGCQPSHTYSLSFKY